MNLDKTKIINGGKYKGRTVGYVLENDISYIVWAKENAPNLIYSKNKEISGGKQLSENDWLKGMDKFKNVDFLTQRGNE